MNIGADELILWLRKNSIGNNIDTKILGNQISETIEKFGGKKLNQENCYWYRTNDRKEILEALKNADIVGDYFLPYTATQYEIDPKILPDIYKEISKY